MGSGYICEDVMSDDLVKRLRKGVMCGDDPIIEEAASRIEKLEAALRSIRDDHSFSRGDWQGDIARKALEEKE